MEDVVIVRGKGENYPRKQGSGCQLELESVKNKKRKRKRDIEWEESFRRKECEMRKGQIEEDEKRWKMVAEMESYPRRK